MDNLKALLGPLRKASLGSHHHQQVNVEKLGQDHRTTTFGLLQPRNTQNECDAAGRPSNTSDNKRQRVDSDAYFYLM